MANLKKSLIDFLEHLDSAKLASQLPEAQQFLRKQSIPDTLNNKKEICLFILSLGRRDLSLFNKNEKLIEELLKNIDLISPSFKETPNNYHRNK